MILKLAGDWKMRAEYQTVMSTQAQRVLGLGSFGADLRYRRQDGNSGMERSRDFEAPR